MQLTLQHVGILPSGERTRQEKGVMANSTSTSQTESIIMYHMYHFYGSTDLIRRLYVIWNTIKTHKFKNVTNENLLQQLVMLSRFKKSVSKIFELIITFFRNQT